MEGFGGVSKIFHGEGKYATPCNWGMPRDNERALVLPCFAYNLHVTPSCQHTK